MIHTNSSKVKGHSSMFNRRPRSILPTFVIILLVISFVYVLYMNNALQVKLKAMDAKTLRYQSQHQSLSSQLQVVYEDRSRLENSLQKEKAEHSDVKDRLQQQKESHESAIEELRNSHNERYKALMDEQADAKANLEKAKKQLNDISAEKHSLELSRVNQNVAAEAHESEKKMLQAENQKLKDQYAELSEVHQKNQALHSNANLQLRQAEEEIRNFYELKNVLKQASADVLNLDHAHFDEMTESDRLLLFSHFGGSPAHAQQLEDRRLQMKNEQSLRNQALQRQQQNREERNRLLAAKQPDALQDNQGIVQNVQGGVQIPPEAFQGRDPNLPGAIHNVQENLHNVQGAVGNVPDPVQNAQIPVQGQEGIPQKEAMLPQMQQQTNICLLPYHPGNCQESHNMYYFDPRSSSCMLFSYTGCGGNGNKFENIQLCEQTCAGLNRNVVLPKNDQPLNVGQVQGHQAVQLPGQMPGNPVQQQQEMQQNVQQRQQNINPVDAADDKQEVLHQIENPDQQNEEPQNNPPHELADALPRGDDRYEIVRQREVPLRPGEPNLNGGGGDRQIPGVDQDSNLNVQDPSKRGEEDNPLDIAEAKARNAEAQAREELDRLSNQAQEDKNENSDKVVIDKEKDPIEQFREVNEKQEQLAKVQAEDLAKFAALNEEKRNQEMKGEITDEEGDRNDEREPEKGELEKKKEEPNDQMLQPPAAKVAEEEQKAVIDVPGVKPKAGGANEEEQYNEDGYPVEGEKKSLKEGGQRYRDDQLEKESRLVEGDEYDEDEDPNGVEDDGLNESMRRDDAKRLSGERRAGRNVH